MKKSVLFAGLAMAGLSSYAFAIKLGPGVGGHGHVEVSRPTRMGPVQSHVGPMPNQNCGLEYRRRIESTLPIECRDAELSR